MLELLELYNGSSVTLPMALQFATNYWETHRGSKAWPNEWAPVAIHGSRRERITHILNKSMKLTILIYTGLHPSLNTKEIQHILSKQTQNVLICTFSILRGKSSKFKSRNTGLPFYQTPWPIKHTGKKPCFFLFFLTATWTLWLTFTHKGLDYTTMYKQTLSCRWGKYNWFWYFYIFL